MSRKRAMTRSESGTAPGSVIRPYSESEAGQLAASWLAVFGKDRQGVNTKAFLWNIFSAQRYPCIDGEAARAEYAKQTGAEFIVLSNDRKEAFLTERLPESVSLLDYYVFPPNLAWTMAFTHEVGWLGPYFARHPDFARLNEANQTEWKARLRKAREIEIARRRGWC